MLKLSYPEVRTNDDSDQAEIVIGDIFISVSGDLAVFMAAHDSERLKGIGRDAAIDIVKRLNALEESVMQAPKPAASRKQRRTK